jgi:hypothetical protein
MSTNTKTDNFTTQRVTLFNQPSIKQLKESDFLLEEDNLIRLQYKDCILVLFYTDNEESLKLSKIWSVAATQAIGAIFAACNIGIEARVAANFASLVNQPNHPFYWARLQQFPYIMVYRGGWPCSLYSGDRAVQPIIDFALTLACEVTYHEYTPGSLSMQIDTNLEMTGTKEAVKRTSSRQFTVGAPLRGYDNSYPVKLVTPAEIAILPNNKPISAGVQPILQRPVSTVTVKTTTTSNIAMPIRKR